MKHARMGLAVLLAVIVAGSVLAQEIRPDSRYVLVQSDNGLIRMDTKTGEVSRCSGDIAAMTCRLLPDERMAYEFEITRLEDRVIDLENRISALELAGNGKRDGSRGPALGLDLPDEKDLDEALTMAEQLMRRFFGMVRDMKDDMKSDNL